MSSTTTLSNTGIHKINKALSQGFVPSNGTYGVGEFLRLSVGERRLFRQGNRRRLPKGVK